VWRGYAAALWRQQGAVRPVLRVEHGRVPLRRGGGAVLQGAAGWEDGGAVHQVLFGAARLAICGDGRGVRIAKEEATAAVQTRFELMQPHAIRKPSFLFMYLGMCRCTEGTAAGASIARLY
jgi:hypothetical protein